MATARKIALALTSLVLAAVALSACAAATATDGSTDAPGAALQSPAVVKSDHLTVCTTDSPPNIYFDDDGELVGIEIDIANAMASELGLEPELLEYSFAGLIPALQAAQCDVIMGSLYIKPEREEIANFVPYLYSGTAVAVSSSNPREITGFDETLCGANVAALNGATGATLIAERSEECSSEGLPAVEITLVDEGVLGLQQLSAGQVDAYVDTSSIVSFYAKQSDGDFDMVGEPFGTIQIGAATLKKNEELHGALSDAFATVIEDGTYDEILAEWGMESEDIRLSY
jgi:polar amino acid transport system substrate-binding protein